MAPDVLQVSFSKSVGNPLEWRRFFKVRTGFCLLFILFLLFIFTAFAY